MKTQKTLQAVKEAENFTGMDLQNFDNLPKNASKERQEEALQQDYKWWEHHVLDIYQVIENAIRTVDV